MGEEPLTTIPPPTLCPMDSSSSLCLEGLQPLQKGCSLLAQLCLEQFSACPQSSVCSPGCWRLLALPRQRAVLQSCPGKALGKGERSIPLSCAFGNTRKAMMRGTNTVKLTGQIWASLILLLIFFSFSKQKVVEA